MTLSKDWYSDHAIGSSCKPKNKRQSKHKRFCDKFLSFALFWRYAPVGAGWAAVHEFLIIFVTILNFHRL